MHYHVYASKAGHMPDFVHDYESLDSSIESLKQELLISADTFGAEVDMDWLDRVTEPIKQDGSGFIFAFDYFHTLVQCTSIC